MMKPERVRKTSFRCREAGKPEMVIDDHLDLRVYGAGQLVTLEGKEYRVVGVVTMAGTQIVHLKPANS